MSVSHLALGQPMQRGVVTHSWDRTDTELARIVACALGWTIAGDAIHDADGALIARSLEDAAAVMKDLQWIVGARSVHWGAVHRGHPAGDLRGGLDTDGCHASLLD